MSMVKRLLAMVLCACMVVGMMPAVSFAEELPDGLYICNVDVDESGEPVPDTSWLHNPDSIGPPLGSSVYRAFYFVEDGQMTQLMLKDLTCDDPDYMQISVLEWNGVPRDGMFEVTFLKYGSTSVSYTKDSVTYTLPIEVNLPSAAFFYESVRSVENYAGEVIPFDGNPEAGETRYMIAEEGWEVTDIRFEDGKPDWFHFELVNGYAVITITEGFESNRQYTCTVEAENVDDPNDTRDWWFGFKVEDTRPKEMPMDLYWARYEDGSYNINDTADCMYDIIGQDINAIFLFWDGDSFEEVPYDELVFPDGLNHSRVDASNAVYMVFDTPMNITIDYTVGDTTYKFPLEVKDPNDSLADGLYWCWGSTLGELRTEISWAIMSEGSTKGISLFLKENGAYIQLNGDSGVTASDELVLNWKDKDGRFTLGTPALGSYEIAYGGYTLPVTVNLPVLSYHDACDRSAGTWLEMGREGEILFGSKGTPDTAWLMWDTAAVGTVEEVTVYFEDVYGAGEVLYRNETLQDAAAALAAYSITLTPSLTEGYIRVDTDFSRAYNLILTLKNERGEEYSRHLNIDEPDADQPVLPPVAFYDEKDRSADTWLKKEWITGGTGDTCTFWFMWDPDLFQVTEKSDFKVYFERNEDDGIELPSAVWNAGVDAFLADNGYVLELDLINNCVEITALFDRTVDFYMYLTDVGGNEQEAQISIDAKDASVQLSDGLYLCNVDRDEDDEWVAITSTMWNPARIRAPLNSSAPKAFYFVENATMTQLKLADLNWDADFLNISVLKDEGMKLDGMFDVYFRSYGSTIISYETNDGDVYELPVTILLDSVALFKEPVRNESNYAGEAILFDGKPSAGETLYMIVEEGWNITDIRFEDGKPDFFDFTIVDGYAVITITDGFEDERQYSCTVDVESADDPNNTNNWWFGFEVEDARPALKWCSVDDPNDILTPETDNMRSSMDGSMNSSNWAAFYFVDGDTKTQLMKDDLSWDKTMLDFELLDEEGEEKDGFFRVRFKKLGSTVISYGDYEIPVTIGLPWLSLYSEPVVSEETCIGDQIVLNGDPAEGETVYLMFRDDQIIKDVSTDAYGVIIELDEDGSCASITLTDEFAGTEVQLKVLFKGPNDEGTSETWYQASVKDERPGLRWCDVNESGVGFAAETNDMNSKLNGSKGGGTWAAFYFVDGDEKTQLMLEDLTWDTDMLRLEKLEQDDKAYDGFFQLDYLEFGEAVITYGDYTLPVTIGLPWLGLYSEPVVSEETFIGGQIVLDGDLAEGETVYLMFRDDQIIKDVSTDADGVIIELDEDGSCASITLTDEFAGNEVQLNVSFKGPGDEGTSETWYQVGVKDKRPGLRFCWGGSVEDVEQGNYEHLESSLNVPNTGKSTYGFGFYFVNGDQVTRLDSRADLDFGDFGKASWNGGEGLFDVQLPKFGSYEIVYTDENGNEYTLPVTVTLPQFGFYSEPIAAEACYLSSEFVLQGDPMTVYLVCDSDGLTITDLHLDTWGNGDDMSFLDWEISDDGSYIEMIISKDVRDDYEYSLRVIYENDEGQEGDYRDSFCVLKKKSGLIWFPAEEDGQGGYTVTDQNVHRDTMTLAPGDSFLLQVRYFDSINYTVLDLADLDLPGFVTVETVDEDNAILRITCNSLGIGTITCDTWEDYNIRVTAQSADALNFYTQPDRNSAYLDRNFNGVDGDVITRYLMWDQTALPTVDKVTVSLNDGMNGNYVVVDEDVATTDLSRFGIELTPDLENGWVKVEATLSDWRNVKFTLWQGVDKAAETVINIDEDYSEWGDDRLDSSNLVFDWYDGTGIVELTIGMGELEEVGGGYRIGVRGGGFNHFTGDGEMHHQICVGALANQGTDAESEAPEEVYNAISDVRFFISRWMNKDGSDNQMESNITVGELYTTELNGKTVWAADLSSEVGGYAYVEVGVTYTVTLDGVTRTNTVYHRFGTQPDTRIAIGASELDTADKLNAVLESTEAMEAWLQENYPEELAAFKASLAYGDFANIEIYLPPVQYDGIIKYGITGLEGPDICGTEDEEGNRTTMPGLWLCGGESFFLSDIDFLADDRYQMTMNGETFTCGLLSWGIGTGDTESGDVYCAQNCTFTGFDYGVYCTATGYSIVRNSIFTDCGVGYLLDCEGKRGGNANSVVDDNRFVYCGVGLWIKSLPDYITPYEFRVVNNDFLSCEVDIDASQPGRLYFFRNYFGKVKGENKHEIPVVADDVHKHAPKVRGRGLATIVANPRWRDPVTFELDREDNHLIVDNKHGLVTYIPADEAAELLLSAAAMEIELNAATNPVEISIVEPGDEGDTLGTWTFPVAQTTTFGLMSGTATDFSAALDISWLDGVQYITVQDSTLLYSRKPTLTVPCSWVDAVVTFNGVPVDSTIVGGKITFTVAEGGTYRIEEVAMTDSSFVTGNNAELTEEDAVISWYDRSEEGAEAPDFLQLGSETVFVEDEMDAEAEGEKYDENAVTETTLLTVEASFKAPVDETVVVLLVLYDENGRMLSMAQQEATQNSGTGTIVVKCDEKLIKTDSVMVKAFVINADGSMTPLSAVPFSQTLNLKAE